MNFFDDLRSYHTPFNPDHDIVKMTMDTNYGYVEGALVRQAIDEMENKTFLVSAGIDSLSALEKLAVLLLTDHIRPKARSDNNEPE